MKEIQETTHLEFDKSAYLIDLVKHDSGLLYIEIIQIINSEKSEQSVKINPSVLTDIINVLQNYKAKIPSDNYKNSKYLSDLDQKRIQDRYLKGITLKELALQFNRSEKLIEMVLRNKGIQIVSNEIPKKRFWRKRRNK